MNVDSEWLSIWALCRVYRYNGQNTCEDILIYIDPGSGSMLIQVMLASAIGSVIALRRFLFGFFSRIKALLSLSKGGER